jgi:hypothetical protein
MANEKILIVDDEAHIIELIKFILKIMDIKLLLQTIRQMH